MDERKRTAGAIRDYLARQRISRDEFAFRTKLGRSTVDKLLIGLYSERTLAIVEGHTGLALRTLSPAGAAVEGSAAPTPPDTPSIAVLPFTSLGGEADHAFLAEGLAEDLTTALGRLRWLLVIARSSTQLYNGRDADIREIAQALGVRYVLSGTTRAAGGRVRITGQLIDAETGQQIWAERYDSELTDIFAVQDDITARVVAAVEPHLYAQEGLRASGKPPESIDAWGLVARATTLLSRLERSRNEEARRLLERALSLAPNYARARALTGWAVWLAANCYWLPRSGYDEAVRHAEAALAQDANDPWARMVFALGLSTARRQERALGEIEAALTLNPSFALGRMVHGWVLLRAGRFDEAIAETGRALRLSPLDSFSGLYTTIHGLALLGARRFAEALPFLRSSVAAFAEYSGHYNTLISCCGHLDLVEEAQEFIAVRNRIGPPIGIAELRRNLEGFAHCEVFLEGLRKAGVPE